MFRGVVFNIKAKGNTSSYVTKAESSYIFTSQITASNFSEKAIYTSVSNVQQKQYFKFCVEFCLNVAGAKQKSQSKKSLFIFIFS